MEDTLDRVQVLERLKTITHEWRIAVGDEPLETVKGSVGYMLEDFAGVLELTPEEEVAVFGSRLKV